jgi:hypothetical protein
MSTKLGTLGLQAGEHVRKVTISTRTHSENTS